MRRAWYQVTSTTFLAVLTLSAAVAAAQPGSTLGPKAGAPPPSEVQIPEPCDAAAAAWARGASQHSGLVISAVACPAGVVRLHVEGAGCDFEVARAHGFQTTADGKFGVSPIANLDWNQAPEPMKKALAGVLAALAQDPSLTIREGEPIPHPPAGSVLLGSRRNQIIAGSAGGALVAAAVGLWLKRRRARPAVPAIPPIPPPADPPAV